MCLSVCVCLCVPWQLPQREEDAELVVELLELIEGAEEKLGLALPLAQEPHHIRLQEEEGAEGEEEEEEFELILVRIPLML